MILLLPKQGQLLSSSGWSQHPNILSCNFSKPKRKMRAALLLLLLLLFSLRLQLDGLVLQNLSQQQKEKAHLKWFSNYSRMLVIQAWELFLISDYWCYYFTARQEREKGRKRWGSQEQKFTSEKVTCEKAPPRVTSTARPRGTSQKRRHDHSHQLKENTPQ